MNQLNIDMDRVILVSKILNIRAKKLGLSEELWIKSLNDNHLIVQCLFCNQTFGRDDYPEHRFYHLMKHAYFHLKEFNLLPFI